MPGYAVGVRQKDAGESVKEGVVELQAFRQLQAQGAVRRPVFRNERAHPVNCAASRTGNRKAVGKSVSAGGNDSQCALWKAAGKLQRNVGPVTETQKDSLS